MGNARTMMRFRAFVRSITFPLLKMLLKLSGVPIETRPRVALGILGFSLLMGIRLLRPAVEGCSPHTIQIGLNVLNIWRLKLAIQHLITSTQRLAITIVFQIY